MSGPTAGTFGIDIGILIAYEAGRAATEIAAGYAEEASRQAALQHQREGESQSRLHATLAARHSLLESIRSEEARFKRISDVRTVLATRLGKAKAALAELPVTRGDDLPALQEHLALIRQLADAANDELVQLAASVPDLSAAEVATMGSATLSLDDQLTAFAIQARLAHQVPESVLANRRSMAQRILARAVMAAGEALPEDLASLAEELTSTGSDERAEAVASELRLRVERHNRRITAEAAARVLEQSLGDLGYEVEGIGETLFMDGGVAHFQKSGWNDYFVRLRVDAVRNTVNFNVVRAGGASEDRRHEDMLAEERWCSEFPRLKETLAARGLTIAVTRMLGAGEMPVQIVDPASLPQVEAETDQRAKPLRAKHI